jgi:hypothetical protein
VCTAGSDKVVGAPGLQTEVEDYESAFFEADEAMRVATSQVMGRRAGTDDGRGTWGCQTLRNRSRI